MAISKTFVACLAALGSLPSLAVAQSVNGDLNGITAASNFARDRNIAVSERPHPEYDAAGVRTGAFMVYPQVETDLVFDDNIYALSSNKTGDSIWNLRPEVSAVSQWSRNYLRLDAGFATDAYQEHSGENTTDWNVSAKGRLDFSGDANVTGDLGTARITEPRTSSNQASGGGAFGPGSPAKPVQYELYSADLGWTKEFNRLKVAVRGDADKYNYDNVAAVPPPANQVFDEDARDRTVTSLTTRADYAISPATALFAEIAGNDRKFRVAPPAGQFRQDSDGSEILVGTNFELGHLMRGELAAGYLDQDYKDSHLRDVSGLGFRGKLEWFPTELTTVTGHASRSVEDSGVSSPTGLTGGYLFTDTGVQIDHELRRNIILTGAVGYSNSQYSEISRTDDRWLFSARATYLLNRRVGINVGISSLRQDSSGSAPLTLIGNKFTDNKLSLSLILRL